MCNLNWSRRWLLWFWLQIRKVRGIVLTITVSITSIHVLVGVVVIVMTIIENKKR